MASFQPIMFGKFTLLERIAVDAVGELYRASHPDENGKAQPLLIKKFLPHVAKNQDLFESLSNCARISSLFKHDNIAQVLDYGSIDDTFYMATAYLSGYPLQHLLKISRERRRPFTPEHALHIATQICRALTYAHEFTDPLGRYSDVIHGNLSPKTVFVTFDGVVKLTDFGTHFQNTRGAGPQLDQMNNWLTYMSPEQVGGGPINHHTDIFSLGVLIYEMLTGHRMFQGKSMEIYSLVRHVKFEPVDQVAPHLSAEMCNLITQAVQKVPDERYPSARDMLQALEKTLSTRPKPTFSHGVSDYFSTSQKTTVTPHTEKAETDEAISQSKAEQADGQKRPESVPRCTPPDQPPTRTQVSKEAASKQVEAGERGRANSRPSRGRPMAWLVGLPAALALVLMVGLAFYGSNRWADRTSQKGTLAEAAVEALNRGDYDQAVSGFERALAARPEDREGLSGPYARALEGLATHLLKENPVKAEQLLLTAKQLDSQQGGVHAALGLLYLNRKDYPKAITSYQKAINLNPEIADVFFNLGYIYALRQEFSKAHEMYARTVELAPPFLDEALFNLALIEARLGQHKESVKNLKRALKFNPENKQVETYLKRLDT